MDEKMRKPNLLALCCEAVAEHGEDIRAVERHVDRRLGAMDEAERGRFVQTVEEILRFKPPEPTKPS